jgi:hypothetical protein
LKIVVRSRVSEEKIKPWRGKHPTREHYSVLITKDCDVYAPDGTPLLAYRRSAVDTEVLDGAYDAFHKMRGQLSYNRAQYAGFVATKHRADGTESRTSKTVNADGKQIGVRSAVCGYFEPAGGRTPFPRECGFNVNHPELWKTIIPCAQAVGNVYRDAFGSRYKAQMKTVEPVRQYTISGTPFSTLTVNNCVSSAYHKDAGDLKSGMGCMLSYRRGNYSGCELVIPEYQLAVDMGHGDVIVFNPRIWHGNLPFENQEGVEGKDWERITIVHYFRERLLRCADLETELKKAKARGAL